MLFNRIKNAKKKLGIEEKLILEKENELGTVNNEEVIIGQDYIDDNSDYDRERPDLGECVPRKDIESPNGLDPDEGILLNDEEMIIGMDYPEEEESDVVAEEFNGNRVSKSMLKEPSIEDKEESMDVLQSNNLKHIDDSGNTFSYCTNFLDKYVDGNDIVQILRRDLMTIMSDMYWIQESNNQNEPFAIDFKNAIKELLW